MSSFITRTKVTTATIPNAASGKVNEYVDSTDGLTYSKDDSGNVVPYSGGAAVAAHVAQADPHPQYETSAEAQAKVNAHANLTNNPHAVTKAQVGLGNCDDTGDLAKPISTATQAALNLKYDVSNPSGYQTAAQQTAAISAAINALVNGSPGALDQLNELAAAMGNDPNFAATLANSLALKAPLASPTFTGTVSGITKAMVGLSNVNNTSDADKPVSTATQTALNLKYDASNPNGYETPTQLNTRDTNNRNRANHGGTQVASTISDFAATVRSTVLTGLSTVTNAVIDATDTVLSALGKLQKQLSDAVNSVNATFAVVNGRLNNLEAKVFGNNYEFFTDTSISTTTSGAQPLTAVASSFITASIPAGTYRSGMQYHWTNNSVTSDSRFALFIDGVQVGNQHNEEYKDNTSNKNDQIVGNVTLAAGNHTIELRFGSENLITTTVSRVDCEFWRVS